jgi:hypothetical protein
MRLSVSTLSRNNRKNLAGGNNRGIANADGKRKNSLPTEMKQSVISPLSQQGVSRNSKKVDSSEAIDGSDEMLNSRGPFTLRQLMRIFTALSNFATTIDGTISLISSSPIRFEHRSGEIATKEKVEPNLNNALRVLSSSEKTLSVDSQYRAADNAQLTDILAAADNENAELVASLSRAQKDCRHLSLEVEWYQAKLKELLRNNSYLLNRSRERNDDPVSRHQKQPFPSTQDPSDQPEPK